MNVLLRSLLGLAVVLGAISARAADINATVSDVPGVIIDHSAAVSRQYIGSPSIAILPSGEYVASHDLFGPGSTNDQTLVFASNDRGRTWARRAQIGGQWWSTLFVHRGELYIIGPNREYGLVVIRRSSDGGRTWTVPKDEHSGLLLPEGKYHCAPVPVVEHDGRLWRAMEDAGGPGGWGSHFRAFLMSVPIDANLLEASNWTCSNRIGRDPSWLNKKFNGWLEGNAVVTPNGQIVDILRVDVPAGMPEKAAIVHISPDGKTATFDPEHDFVDFPGGAKKFTIRFDPTSQLYWSLANAIPAPAPKQSPGSVRNTLCLTCSKDLREWKVGKTILHNPDVKNHGFQYVDWLLDGDDIIAAVRCACNDDESPAHNFHDANYLIFVRVERFRDGSK